MKRCLVVLLIGAAGSSGLSGSQSAPGIFTRLDPVVDTLWSGFDTRQASSTSSSSAVLAGWREMPGTTPR